MLEELREMSWLLVVERAIVKTKDALGVGEVARCSTGMFADLAFNVFSSP